MLSCAAIQKLERYGQLGLKRSCTEDFVLSSLKDARRTNVYALTHTATWQECLDAILQSGGGTAAAAPVIISDALVYAASFAASFVSQHLFHAQQAQLIRASVGEEASAAPAKAAAVTVAGGATKKRKDTGAQDDGGGSQAPVFLPESGDRPAAVLVTLLKRVVVQIAREGNRGGGGGGSSSSTAGNEESGEGGGGGGKPGGIRIAESKEFTQALTHLVSNLSVMLVYAFSVDLNARIAGSARRTEEEKEEASCVWRDGLVLLAAATRLLRRASAALQQTTSHGSSGNNKGEESLFTARTANALVRQFVAKHQNQQQQQQQQQEQRNSGTRSGVPGGHGILNTIAEKEQNEQLQAFPMPQVLLNYTNVLAASAVLGTPMASGFAFFENFSMLQKLSLLHAVLPDMARLRTTLRTSANPLTSRESTDTASAAFVESSTQALLKDLISPSACNRATRYVLYFRGDDLKLMQSKITQPSQYALHTFATTPPVEPSIVDSFRAAMERMNATPSPSPLPPPLPSSSSYHASLWEMQRRCFYAVLFAQWVVSAPLFFEAFCSDPSWCAFAEEQRRTTLLRQAQERRHKRDDTRKSKRSKRDGDGSNSGGATSGQASETASLADGENEDSDAASTLSMDTNTHGNHSIAPSLETSRSLLSLESRASLLSTLSKQSAATYMSFLSVLKPTGDDAHSAEPAKYHESADGNSNLPLILLEELVLGLHRFMEAFPADELDRVGLRSLCWQSIGRLFAFIQGSISIDGSLAPGGGGAGAGGRPQLGKSSVGGGSAPATIFNLGTDLRYNHGLGYESLGLLFAKVIAPQFEAGRGLGNAGLDEDGTRPSAAALPALGRASVLKSDPTGTKRVVEAALSRCLSAYEEVAPQVVDMNLPTILRIAARTAADASSSLPSHAHTGGGTTSGSVEVLYDFLAGIITRLGKCNQVPVLLEALVSSSAATRQREPRPSSSPARDTAATILEEEESEEEDVAALQIVFSHTRCRAALIQASGLSMDPENLIGQLLKYVSVWSLGDSSSNDDDSSGGGGEGERGGRQDPQHVMFVLKLVATVLEGLQPTSMTSSAVLERSTELEMLLSAFAQKHLYHTPSRGNAGRQAGTGLFRTPELRPKVRRQLWLHALYCLYRCRMVTTACLRDLGLQNVKDYLHLLNASLWQVDSHVGALLLSAGDGEHGEDDEQAEGAPASPTFSVAGGFGYDDLAGQLSPTTHMALPPFAHIQTLLPMLSLQRLRLARSVATVLGCEVAPAADAKGLAHAVLDAITAFSSLTPERGGEAEEEADLVDGTATVPARGTTASAVSMALLAFSFINDMSEEDWASLVQFAKKKRLRVTLVALLKHTFASATYRALQADSPCGGYVAPVWLTRCLRCAGGVALRAMTDMFLTYTVDDIVEAAGHESATEDAEAKRRRTHPSGTQQQQQQQQELLAMLAALQYTYRVVGHMPYWPLLVERATAWLEAVWSSHHQTARSSEVTAALLAFLQCALSYEGKSGDVIRKALLAAEGVPSAVSAPHPRQQPQHRRGLSRLYLEEVGVLAKEGDTDEQDDENENYLDDELSAFADELHAFTQRSFSEGFVRLLLSLANDAAMGVLSFLYHTATLASRVAHREGRYTKEDVKVKDCAAARYIALVADSFRTLATATTTTTAAGANTSSSSSSSGGSISTCPHTSLLGFLNALGRLPTGESALTPGLPRKSAKSAKKKSDTAAAREDVVGFVNGTEAVWLATLRFYISVVASPRDAPLTPATLYCLTALYARLLASYSRTYHGKDAVHGGASAATSFAALLLHSGGGDGDGEPAAGLHEALVGLFTSGNKKKGEKPSSTTTGVAMSVSTFASMLPLPSHEDSDAEDGARADCAAGMVALWVLYNLFHESVSHGGRWRRTTAASTGSEDGGGGDGGSSSSSGEDHKRMAATLVSSFLAHLPLLFTSERGSEEYHLLLASVEEECLHQQQQEQTRVPRSSKQHVRLGEAAFRLRQPSAQQVSPRVLATFYEQALGAAVRALQLLRADAAPALLTVYIQSLLSQCVAAADAAAPSSSSALPFLLRGAGSSSSSSSPLLLPIAARAMYCLARTPGVKVHTLLKPHMVTLLSASTTASCLAAAAVSGQKPGGSMYELLLTMLQIPAVSAAITSDDVSLDVAWTFLTLLLEENSRSNDDNSPTYHNSNSNNNRNGARTARFPVADTQSKGNEEAEVEGAGASAFVLSQAEVMAMLSLLARTWLPGNVLWRRVGQVPTLLNAIFEAVLVGVRDGRYERRVLSQVTALFHLLVKLGIDASEEAQDEPLLPTAAERKHGSDSESDEEVGGSKVQKEQEDEENTKKREGAERKQGRKDGSEKGAAATTPSSPPRRFAAASEKTRVLCLAAIVADMFQLSRHYITVFTVYSSDLDYVARDFLRALSELHLPKVKGTPIAHHPGVKIRPTQPSPATFADLVYTCVGDEECKALLRQAALRLDEEEVEQGGGGTSEGLVERRHIFNVDV